MWPFSHPFCRTRKWKRVTYEESCSPRVNERKGSERSSCALWQVFRRKASCVSVERKKLDTVLTLFNAMHFNATRTQFHYRGSAFVAYVLYGSLVKMTWSLVHYLIQMWNSGMEPSKLWVWIHTFSFCCSCVFSLGLQQQSIKNSHGQW